MAPVSVLLTLMLALAHAAHGPAFCHTKHMHAPTSCACCMWYSVRHLACTHAQIRHAATEHHHHQLDSHPVTHSQGNIETWVHFRHPTMARCSRSKEWLRVPDALVRARGERVVLRALHQLQVPHGGQLQAQVLQRLPCTIDDCHIQHDVVLVHRHVSLSIHWICKACAAQV